MTETKAYQPSVKLKAASLRQKTSANGNRYLIGRLGGVKIVENRHRKRVTRWITIKGNQAA
jgi:hypothetical protein